MDLIDRKELLKRMNIIANTVDWYSETMDGFEYGTGMIEDTPTVDAIPIEWLEKQVADGYYGIAEIMYHWEFENNIKENILFGGENEID